MNNYYLKKTEYAKKSPEQKAEEDRRYILASDASNTATWTFLTDLNQAIRVTTAINADILERFADDKFGVCV